MVQLAALNWNEALRRFRIVLYILALAVTIKVCITDMPAVESGYESCASRIRYDVVADSLFRKPEEQSLYPVGLDLHPNGSNDRDFCIGVVTRAKGYEGFANAASSVIDIARAAQSESLMAQRAVFFAKGLCAWLLFCLVFEAVTRTIGWTIRGLFVRPTN